MRKGLSWDYDEFLEFPAEKPPSNRFGRYWTEGTGSWTGQSGRPLWFRTAPPPRVDVPHPLYPGRKWAAAAHRWAAKQPVGRPPFKLKWAQALASLLIANELRLSNDPCAKQRLRDLRVHILERRRHSGSLFRDKDRPTAAQFARGIRWAELEGIEQYRRHDQLRWFVDARFEVDDDAPFIDSAIAASAGYGFQEVDNTIARRRKRPLRERRKPGRKPTGLIAQTTAERVRKHRRNKVLKRSPPTSVATAGAAQLCAPELTAPAALSTHAQGGDTT